MTQQQITADKDIWLTKEISKFISYGYYWAYSYRPSGTLLSAITFKFLATSEKGAIEIAENIHMKDGEREIKVWDLKKELAELVTKD